ncbi:MAG TPA: hemerythrin domain-containing protein [Polyangiales bacterium]
MPGHLQEVAAKVMGKAKVAKGAIEGLSGIFTTLMEEHGHVAALMMRLKGSADVALRRTLWPKIRAELLSHEQGELLVLYPVYRAHPELAQIAAAHERDATQLTALIDELDTTDMTHALWGERFAGLVQAVQRHVKDEERDFFREGNRVFGSQNKALDAQFKRTKQRALDELT